MKRVLLIEPDIVLGEAICKYLNARELSVNWARDGQAAVHIMDENQPDAIVMEVQLAGHNGVSFLYEIRTYKEWQNIPVIIYTNLPTNSLPVDKNLLSIHAVLYKPETKLSQLWSEAIDAMSVKV